MGQKDGEKWTAAVDLQPTIPKSDRLLKWRLILVASINFYLSMQVNYWLINFPLQLNTNSDG